jgi:hypothetical protein
MRGVEQIAKPAERVPAPPVFRCHGSGRAPAEPHEQSAIVSRREGVMYATIRRFTLKTGTLDQNALDKLRQRIEDGLVPSLQEIRGFHGYHVVNVGNKELVSFNLFEDKAGATESNRRSAEFVKKDPIKDQLGGPDTFEGEVLVSKEALIGTR